MVRALVGDSTMTRALFAMGPIAGPVTQSICDTQCICDAAVSILGSMGEPLFMALRCFETPMFRDYEA